MYTVCLLYIVISLILDTINNYTMHNTSVHVFTMYNLWWCCVMLLCMAQPHPPRPSDERPPVMYGHFCLVPRVSAHRRYYCSFYICLYIITSVLCVRPKNNCVTKDHFSLTMLRWTIKVFYYYSFIIIFQVGIYGSSLISVTTGGGDVQFPKRTFVTFQRPLTDVTKSISTIVSIPLHIIQ